MKKTMIAMLALCALNAFAEAPPLGETPTKEQWDAMTPAERKMSMEYRSGGHIVRPGTRSGTVTFVNSQSKAARDVLQGNIEYLTKKTGYSIQLKDGAFSFPAVKKMGEVSLFVIDDGNIPTILSAPEDGWVAVNVARLDQGYGSKTAIFNARVQKELTRGFCLLAGSQDSNYNDSLLGPIMKPEDLDVHEDCRFPIDILRRFKPYLAKWGVTPGVMTTYRRACEEGWAPAPTNDAQRKIWEQVHQIPDKPITIEFDPKKDK